MGPRNPFRTSVGRLPEWSMCAWERITESMESTGKGKWLLRSKASWRRPWYRPQSRRKFLPPVSTWCMEPVTVLAAPQNVIFTVIQYTMSRLILLLFLVGAPIFGQKKPVTLESLKAVKHEAEGAPT